MSCVLRMLACVCIGLVLIVVVGCGGAANCGPVGVSVLPNAATADHTLPRRIISSSSSQPTIFRSSRAARRLRRQSLIMSPGRPPTPVMSPSAYARLDLRRRNLHKCRQQPSDDHRHTAPTGRQHVYRHRIVDLQMKEDASGKRHTNTWLKAKCCKIRETSGSNSAVECDLAKVEVAGSNPVSRSRIQGNPAGWWCSLVRERIKLAVIASHEATLRAARPDTSLCKERLLRMTIKLHHYRLFGSGSVSISTGSSMEVL